MIIVKKDNRVLHIDELEEQAYLEDGYDVVVVVDGEYQVVKPSTGGRIYSTAEYRAVQEERDALKADIEELEKSKIKKSTVTALESERDALKAELEQVKTELATVKANLTVANARNGEPLV
jgi:hypothetical protein|nr:MAG TPA: hypothetical protein [Caudoviricetes sp.]